MSPLKIMIIVAVVLLLLGPDNLPEVAHKLGSSWRALKRLQERVESEVREAIPDLPSSNDIARIARSPVHLLNQLADRVDQKEESDATAARAAEAPPAPPAEAVVVAEAVAPPIPKPTANIVLPPDPSLN